MRPFKIDHLCKLFGEQVSGIFKRWIDTNYKLIRTTSQIHFLKTCKCNKLIPTHLSHLYKTSYIYKHYKTIHKLNKVIYNSQVKILNIEIFDLHRLTYTLNRNLSFLSFYLSNNIPPDIFNKIIRDYSERFHKYKNRLLLKYSKKFFCYNKKTMTFELRTLNLSNFLM